MKNNHNRENNIKIIKMKIDLLSYSQLTNLEKTIDAMIIKKSKKK